MKYTYALFLLCVMMLVGCSISKDIKNNEDVIITNSPTNSPNVEPKESVDPAFNFENQKLFEGEIITYNPAEVVNFQLNNKEFSTTFVKDKFLPFGFYMPSNMEIYSFEDGDIWGYDNQRNHVSIVMYDNIVEDLKLYKENLTQYDEYVGSDKSYDQYIDYFLLEHNDKKYIIMLSYYDSEKETALPLFLKFIKTIRSIEN